MKKNYRTPMTEVIKTHSESYLLAGTGDSSDPTKPTFTPEESEDLILD